MSRFDQSGVAMVSVLLAIFILTISVAALVLATMGETTLSFDQSRSSQALHLAEAGAFRALGELRRRMSVDLDLGVRTAPGATIFAQCTANQGWRVIAAYAGSGWTDELANRRAVLAVGTPADPVEVRGPGGTVLGSFYATIYVRNADNRAPPLSSNVCDNTGAESYQMPFDYFIIATGVTRNARRTVCLQNIGNAANCRDWLASASPGGTSWDTSPASHGWQVWIERAAYTRWALMLLETSDTWMTGTTTFNGPVHSNSRFWMWGNPTFAGQVTQFENDVFFGNSGSPVLLTASSNPLPDQPVYQVMDLQRNTARVDPPADNNPAWAVLGQDPALSGMPTDADVRARTTQLADTADPVPDGIYFMDECGSATCGGIHVQGNVLNMVLAVEATKQVIYIVTPTESRKFILDSATNTRVCTPPPTYATCIDLGKGFNGILFVQGSITSDWTNPDTGLFGTVQKDTRMTIAANGEIRIGDHLVYEQPPTGPDDPISNVLGLYAWCGNPLGCAADPVLRNVTVDTAIAPNDLFIDASVLAPWGKFWAEWWDLYPDKGTLHFLGGTVQKDFGEWGGFGTDALGNPILTGYGREMTYDQRFMTNTAPPFFPLTVQYTALRWPRMTTDALYDRPTWRELLGP